MNAERAVERLDGGPVRAQNRTSLHVAIGADGAIEKVHINIGKTDAVAVEDYDGADMALLKQTRTAALELLAGHETKEALALLLLYGAVAQQGLDTGEMEDFDIPTALETGRSLRQTPDMPGFFRFFRELEILTPRWAALLRTPAPLRFPPEMKAFARYLVERYWLQAISDFDLMGRVKFIVISCLLVGSLPGDFAANAQLFSKEIENDADNVDAILDAAGTCRPFTDSRLLGSLLL